MGVEFENTINLADPTLPRSILDHDVDFAWDNASSNQFSLLLNQLDPSTEEIHATVVGLFVTKVPTEKLIYLLRPNEPHRVGYGHLGGHPAQIIVKTMYNMRVQKKPPADEKK